jgi:CelD/BcsL family acetyltransferase involved in cellulose biosynthesis
VSSISLIKRAGQNDASGILQEVGVVMDAVLASIDNKLDSEFTGSEITASLEVLPRLDRLATMWRDLECRADASFFLSWDWIGTWLTEAGIQPLLMIGRRSDQVVALGLLERKLTRIGPLALETLWLNETGSHYFDCINIEFNDFLLDRTCMEESRKACLNELLRVRRNGSLRWHELRWHAAPQDVTRAINPADFHVQVCRTASSALIDLGMLRQNKLDLLEYLSRNTRYGIQRSIRLYEKWGPLRIARATSRKQGLVWLDELRRLHQIRWEAKGECGAFGNPFFDQFVHKILERSPSNSWDILKIVAGGTPIGYLINFSYRGVTMNYQSGFLYDADGRYKPGLVSHLLAVRYFIGKRPDVHTYSFLVGDAQYKSSLSTSSERLNWYSIKPRTLSLLYSWAPLRRCIASLSGRAEEGPRSARRPEQ